MLIRMKTRVFSRNEDGAITVDWVVLTASVIVLALAGYLGTRDGVNTASSNVSSSLGAIKAK